MTETHTPRRIPGPTQPFVEPVNVRSSERIPAKQDEAAPPAKLNPQRAYPALSIGKVAGAIAAIMSEVGVVEKGGHNDFHGYDYVRMEDILKVVTPLMGKHGLVVIQNEVERGIIETRITVTYEFSIIHSSGEFWPERPRFTGMCNARDKKGGLDDKAINKCHTAARKYFLSALFQVPSGADDADEEPAPTRQQPQQPQHRTVPGPPGAKNKQEAWAPLDGAPHKLVLQHGATADSFANAYIRAIGKAKSPAELEAWDTENDAALQRINDGYPEIYRTITAAVERRYIDLGATPVEVMETVDAETGEVLQELAMLPEMPDPKVDATVAVNWVAQCLADFKTYEAAEAFWSDVVLPRDREFERPDFAVLSAEWQRARARLAGT